MGRTRKLTVITIFLCSAFVYYLLFFTPVFNAQMREVAYILSGHPYEAAKRALENRVLIAQMGDKAIPLYQYYSATLVSQLQYGPYMNLTVYMTALFSVVPIFLVATYLQNTKRVFDVNGELEHARKFKKQFFNYLVFTFIISGIGSILSVLLASIFLKSGPTSANQAAIQNNLQANFIITFIPIAILAPIVEEVVFRGVLLSSLKRFFEIKGTWKTKQIVVSKKHELIFTYAEVASLLFSSTLFALIHLSTNLNQWVYFPVYFCGGVALGGIYIINRERIYTSMLIHGTYNALPVLMMAIIRLVLGGK